MVRAEVLLVVASGLVASAIAALSLARAAYSSALVVLGAALAADVVGGAVANVTDTTKRWYGRPDATTRSKFVFIAVHLMHIVVVGWAFRGEAFDWPYVAAMGGLLLIAAATVLKAPATTQLPLAVIASFAAFALDRLAFRGTPHMEWFATFLFLKLIVGHAIPLRVEGQRPGDASGS